MNDFVKLLEKSAILLEVLTVKKAILTTLFVFVGLTFFILWKSSDRLALKLLHSASNGISMSTDWELSAHSISQLKYFQLRHSLVGYLAVNKVKIKSNVDTTIFENVSSKKLFVRSLAKKMSPLLNGDALHTKQMIAILGNEFRCDEFSRTRLVERIAGPKSGVYVCRLAIPPTSEDFHGYLTFVLIRKPSVEEMQILKIEGLELTIQIYTDVLTQRGKDGLP